MPRQRSPQDLASAVVFVLFGAAGLWFGRDYTLGTAARMGPGYTPMLLSVGLILCGIVVGVRALTRPGPLIEPIVWRTNALVLSAILSFVVLIGSFGLAVATFVVTALSAWGSPESRWKDTLLLALFLAVFSVVVFVYALRQPMSVLGPG
jgi:Tripartite tricarboxylate transporter TctB family